MWITGTDLMELRLHDPADGFYLGTRFDRGGVFDSLRLRGVEFCDRWFERYDPRMHDAVCGPAEEFSQLGFEQAAPGETFLKIGVGLLRRPDTAPYDRFRLYEITDPGVWEVSREGEGVRFRHRLEGWYDYSKTVEPCAPAAFLIRHELAAERPLDTTVYNHNFFTLGRLETGPGRLLDFPGAPGGSWRSVYDSVAFAGSGIRFSRILAPGESVYSGDVRWGDSYAFTLREGGLAVHAEGDVPPLHAVFWANHRIACIEPYNGVSARPGSPFRWSIKYTLENE